MEKQFSRSVDRLKDGIPTALLIDGHNPIKVLHKALSKGLHNDSDAECLAAAAAIRIVLIELASRIAELSRHDRAVQDALAQLMQPRNPPDTGRA